MAELLDKKQFEIDVNELNPNGFCLIHVELDDEHNPVDWTFVYVNHSMEKIEGKTVEEMTGHRFFELFPNGDRKWLRPYYEAAYCGKGSSFSDISEEVGRYLHVDTYPAGTDGYCICMLRDIKKDIYERAKRREALETAIHELEDEKRINIRVREFASAMGMVYPLAISMDYKNDSYQMIEYDTFINKTAAYSGNIDELIRVGASTVPDAAVAKQFWELFNRDAVIRAFSEGKREITLRHPQNGDDGKIHYMDTRVICTEYSPERVEAISLSKCIDEEAERDRIYMVEKQHTEVIDALSTIYTTIMQANLRTHGYRVIKSLSLMKTATDGEDEGNFDNVVESVLTYFMDPDFIADMRVFLNLGTLSERLENTNTLLTEYKNTAGRWIEARFIAQQRDENGHALTALYVAHDVTAEKEKELAYREKLREAALDAEKANVSKTNFLRRMSHDIRTPLNGIIGMLRIADRYRDDRQKFDECMDKILHSADYLLDLVNNVLDISKLESGSIVLENKPFDLGQILLNTLPVVAATASENSIIFLGGRDSSHVKHRYVIGSPVHLNRVLMNIASNAVKYNRPGGTIKLYCNELCDDGDNATFEFVCEDTGLGMSEEFQKRAFDPFSQEGKETTTSFSGSGLGLSIVHDVVELMGGTTELKSQENVGTTIRIVLTMPIDKNRKPSAEAAGEVVPGKIEGRRALLVEDNDLNLEIARTMLEEMGLIVTEAKNGLVALSVFQQSEPNTFDYIFMDMMMPKMDGLEATRRIRALDRPDAATVPIIAMTANAFAEDKQACLDAGMNDHVGKPIEISALNHVIMKYTK